MERDGSGLLRPRVRHGGRVRAGRPRKLVGDHLDLKESGGETADPPIPHGPPDGQRTGVAWAGHRLPEAELRRGERASLLRALASPHEAAVKASSEGNISPTDPRYGEILGFL